jgi:hypothetical protein
MITIFYPVSIFIILVKIYFPEPYIFYPKINFKIPFITFLILIFQAKFLFSCMLQILSNLPNLFSHPIEILSIPYLNEKRQSLFIDSAFIF